MLDLGVDSGSSRFEEADPEVEHNMTRPRYPNPLHSGLGPISWKQVEKTSVFVSSTLSISYASQNSSVSMHTVYYVDQKRHFPGNSAYWHNIDGRIQCVSGR